MKYFITGATGYIGYALTQRLVSQGHTIHALVRSLEKARILNHPEIKVFKGDINDTGSLISAMTGCEIVFHLAAEARPGASDNSVFERNNVEGTQNVLQTALNLKIKKVVLTSSAGTIQPSGEDTLSDESIPRSTEFFNEYEETKAAAEALALKFAAQGLDVCIVNPSRVYGPGLPTVSNAVTRIIDQYYRGKWRVIPGDGKSIGNYTYINDVVEGHILASEKGRAGERYILGGENLSFNELFQIIKKVTGKKRLMIKFPVPLMLMTAWILQIYGHITRSVPLITPNWVRKYMYHWRLSNAKAISELGYKVTPFEQGCSETFTWLLSKRS